MGNYLSLRPAVLVSSRVISNPSNSQNAGQFSLPSVLKTLIIILLLCCHSARSYAQLPCFDVTTLCGGGSDPAVWALFKCIQGPVNVSTLLNNELYSQAIAATTKQYIVINGTLTVDISTASGGYSFVDESIIFLNDENSEIVVAPGCQLTLDKVSVRGCSKMWKNIKVLEGGSLIVKNGCDIFYGIKAINALPYSSISITDNIFRANLEAISIGTEIGITKLPVNTTPGGGMWGNNISGGNLKPPYFGNKSLKGINMVNVSSFSIGNTAHTENFIHDFENTFGNSVT